MATRILRRKSVQERTGLPTSTLYAMIADGDFPKPIKLGKRSVGWFETEVEAWIDSRASLGDA